MKHLVLVFLFLQVHAELGRKYETRDAYIQSNRPFTTGFQYTFQYEADLKVETGTIKGSTGVKVKSLVTLDFVKSKWVEDARIHEVKLTLKDTSIHSTSTAISMTPGKLSDEDTQHFETGVTFSYKNGEVGMIWFHENEPSWISNIKRGVINLFNVDISRRHEGREQGRSTFEKTETTIYGVCNCTYIVSGGDGDSIQNINKFITGNKCELPTGDYEFFGMLELKNELTIDLRVMRTHDNKFKILSVTGTGNSFATNVTGNSNQNMILVQERKSVSEALEDSKVGDLKLYLSKRYDSSRIWVKAREFQTKNVHHTLVKFSKIYNDIDGPISKEFATYVSNVVQWLRTLDFKQLDKQWEACMSDSAVRELFLRMFSLVRTSNSVKLMSDKIRSNSRYLSPTSVEIFLDMLSMYNGPFKAPDILKINDICSHNMVRANGQLKRKCLMTYVVLRQRFCETRSCDRLPLPTTMKQVLQMETFSTLNQAEKIQYLQIAESAKEPELVKPIIEIIKNKNIPLRVRKHAALALRPLIYHVRSQAATYLLRLLNQDQSQELRHIIYVVLLDSPTPSIIRSCAQNMYTEQSITIRQFVYKSLLSIATVKHGFFLPACQKAASDAVRLLINQNLVPESVRWLSPIYSNSTKPDVVPFAIYWKVQLPQTNDSLIPKDFFARFDVKMFGKSFNVLDLQIESDGMQEFIAQIAGISSKDKQESNEGSDLRVSGNLKVFGQHWVTESKTMNRDRSWTKLAEMLRDGFKHDTKAMSMPFDIVMKLPTALGIPMVYDTSYLMLQKMENFVQTRSPKLLDIPNFFFGKMKVKSHFIHKQRLMIWAETNIYLDSPIVKAGFHVISAANVSFDGQINMKTNINTMETTTDFEMPKLPEIVTVITDVEMFNTDSKNPIAASPVDSFITLKVSGTGKPQYLSVNNQEVVIADRSHMWKIIPATEVYYPEVVSLYSPDQGYLYFEPSTKKLKISKERKSYIQLDSSNSVALKTFVADNLRIFPRRKERVDLMFKNNGVFRSETVQVVYLKYDRLEDDLQISQDEPTYFIKEDRSKICDITLIPYCIEKTYGDNSFSMRFGVSFLPSVKKIQVKGEVVGSKHLRKYSLKLSIVGPKLPITPQVTLTHDTRSRKINLDIFKDLTSNDDRWMCFQLQYPGNNAHASISLDAACQHRHLEVYSIRQRFPMPYSKQCKIIARWDDTLPVYYKKMLVKSYWTIRKIAIATRSEWMEDLTKLFISKGPEIVVDGRLYLSSPKQIRFSLSNTRDKFVFTVPLPTSLDRIPYGTYQYAFLEQVANIINKPVCVHQQNTFKTFDQVKYNYDISNKCEHILVKTCSKYAPSLQVLVKEVDALKHIRINFEDSKILITPTEYSVMPQVWINDRFQDTYTLKNKIRLPNGMTIQFHWIQETQSLFVIDDVMGMELKLVAGRSIYVRFSNLLFGQLCGLCGNMNSEQSMEMTTPELVEVTDSNIFGWSWMVTGKQCQNDACSLKLDYKRFTNGQDQCTTQVKIPQCFEKKDTRRNNAAIALRDVPAVCGKQRKKVVIKTSIFSVPTKCYCMV